MKYFDAEIKHLGGFKFNSGERVKFLATNHNRPSNKWSSFYDGVETDRNRNIWSTFYDGVNCSGRELKEKQNNVFDPEREEPMMESWNGLYRDDWDD